MANNKEQQDTDDVKTKPLNKTESKFINEEGVPSSACSVTGPEPAASDIAEEPMMMQPTKDSYGEGPATENITRDADSDVAEPDDDGEAPNIQMAIGAGKKKRKSKKPKSKRGLNAPSGFEEYYVDAPLTPAEYEEEKLIYDPSYQFTQRIETAIQRFSAKRKFDNEMKQLFDKYLVHGGVEGGQKIFGGGLDAETLKTKKAPEIAELAATHYVNSDKIDALDSTHVVDFEGCLKSFLSGPFLSQWDVESEQQVKKLVGVLRNFFNYLLHHDVCPEYKDQVFAARSLCDRGATELWNVTTVTALLPGDFNMACSEIFGGMYQGMNLADRVWMDESDDLSSTGISPERARHVFKIGIAANADDKMFSKYRQQLSAKDCRQISTEETSFEITEIIHADNTVLALYAQKQSAGLKILGKMKAKTWSNPRAPDEDLTEEEEVNLKANPPKPKIYEFWLEEEILEKCELGMKFEATIRETSFGLSYFDAIGGIYCSFYQVIPNDFMRDWREIEKEWLPMKYNKYRAAQRSAEEREDGVADEDCYDAIADQSAPTVIEQVSEKVDEGEKEGEHFEVEAEAAEAYIDRGLVAAGYDDEFDELQSKTEEASYEHDAGLQETAEGGFGVKVHKVGEELKEVTGNADRVRQKNFDVKRTEQIE